MCLPVDLCTKTPDQELNDGEFPAFTVDDCLMQSECITQLGEHLTKEFSKLSTNQFTLNFPFVFIN